MPPPPPIIKVEEAQSLNDDAVFNLQDLEESKI